MLYQNAELQPAVQYEHNVALSTLIYDTIHSSCSAGSN